jgi:hypothetical protein
MRIQRDRLEQLERGGKARVAKPPSAVAAPVARKDTQQAPVEKKKWRFDVNRDYDGYITNVVATEL